MTSAPSFRIAQPPSAARLAPLLTGEAAATLTEFIRRQRWFGAKTRQITAIGLADFAERPIWGERRGFDALVRVTYADAADEMYYVPLAAAAPELLPAAVADRAERAIFELQAPGERLVLYEAVHDDDFMRALVRQAAGTSAVPMQHGAIRGQAIERPDALEAAANGSIRLLSGEQSNTSALIGDRFVLKAFRRLEPGASPELEISRFLTERTAFRNSPALAGYLEYHPANDAGDDPTLAVITRFVANEGDGWEFTLRQFQSSLGRATDDSTIIVSDDPAERMRAASIDYVEAVRRLAVVTADLHIALASDATDPRFAPEPITSDDVERWLSGMFAAARQRIEQVAAAAGRQTPEIARRLLALLPGAATIEQRFASLRSLARFGLHRIRTHGDYHLGQTLWTGNDFFIFDFEGEPAISLEERREKRPALKDVAGMLRSFDYAAHAGALDFANRTNTDLARLGRYQAAWREAVRAAFLSAYLEQVRRARVPLVPAADEQVLPLLQAFELEKAIYELAYEANNRPTWVEIPLAAVEAALAGDESSDRR